MENKIIKTHMDIDDNLIKKVNRIKRISDILNTNCSSSNKLNSIDFYFPINRKYNDSYQIFKSMNYDINTCNNFDNTKQLIKNMNKAFIKKDNNSDIKINENVKKSKYFDKNYRNYVDDININQYFKQDIHKLMNHPYYSIKKHKLKQSINCSNSNISNDKSNNYNNCHIDNSYFNAESNNNSNKLIDSNTIHSINDKCGVKNKLKSFHINNSTNINENILLTNDSNNNNDLLNNIKKIFFRQNKDKTKDNQNSKKSINVSIIENDTIIKPTKNETKMVLNSEKKTIEKVVQTNQSNIEFKTIENRKFQQPLIKIKNCVLLTQVNSKFPQKENINKYIQVNLELEPLNSYFGEKNPIKKIKSNNQIQPINHLNICDIKREKLNVKSLNLNELKIIKVNNK